MAEAMEINMELKSNPFEMPQLNNLLARSREWWKSQNIKGKRDFVAKIPQIVLFRHEFSDQWQETLAKLRTLPTAKLSATFMDKLHCPRAVAESLTTLTEGKVLDKSGLEKQEQALQTISREISLATDTDTAKIRETILYAAGAMGTDKPPSTYKRVSSQTPKVSSSPPPKPQAEPPSEKPKKEKEKAAPKKTLLEERPDRSRLATGVAIGGVTAVLLACSVYLWGQIGLNIRQEASGEQNLSKAYKDLLDRSDVQALVNNRNLAGLTSTDTGSLAARGINPTVDARDRVLDGIDRTQVYLQESSTDNWQNLMGYLNTDQPITNEQVLNVLGQQFALQQAKPVSCLYPNGHINLQACDNQPGFKNLDAKTKQEYIQKYNTFIDQAKIAHPSLFGGSLQPRNIDRSPERQQQARAFQAANVRRNKKEFRSVRRSMG